MAEKERRQAALQTPIGRATFVHLFEPQEFKAKDGEAADPNKKPQYGFTLAFDSDTVPKLKELKGACLEAAMKKFSLTREKAVDAIKKGKLRMPWRPNSDYEDYGEPFDQDGLFIRLSTTNQPGIVNKAAKAIMKQSEVYSGMYARASFGVWAYDTRGNKGVTLLLNNVQKTGDGERLSMGAADPEEEFSPISGGKAAVDDDDEDTI